MCTTLRETNLTETPTNITLVYYLRMTPCYPFENTCWDVGLCTHSLRTVGLSIF